VSEFKISGSAVADVDSFIREMNRMVRSLDDAAKKADELDRALDSLSSRAVDIRVDVEGEEAIRKLREDLDRLDSAPHDVEVRIDADTAGITRLREDIREINAIGDSTVKVKVEVTGMAEVIRLEAMLLRLTTGRHTINIDIDGVAQSIGQLIALRGAIEGVDGAGRAAGGSGGGLSSMGGGMSLMLPAIAGLIPMAASLIEVFTGVGAGIFGSMATAGLGVGAFAVFAMPTFKAIMEASKKTDAEIAKLPKDVQFAVHSLQDFKNHFVELQNQLQPTVMIVWAEALNFARAGMDNLFKAAKPAGDAIANLLKRAAEAMQNPAWQGFFDYIAKNTGFFIDTWGTAVGNFILGIANMIQAFDPLSKFVSTGFLGMSESFVKWTQNLSQNKAFQEFVTFTMTEGPKVLELIGQIIAVFWTLTTALAPIGMNLIEHVTAILAWVGAWMKANPELATTVFHLIGMAAILIPIISSVSSLIGVLGGLSGPVLAVIAVIVAVVAVILVWWNKCETFRDFVKEMWEKISTWFMEGITKAKKYVSDILPMIVELWDKYGKNIMQVVEGAWKIISSVISGAMNIIGGIIKFALGLLTGDWHAAWEGVKQVVKGVWDTIKGVVSGGIDMVIGLVKGSVNMFMNAGKAIMDGLWKGIEGSMGWIKDKFKGFIGGLRNMLPFSPAKEGPFSGKGYPLYSGMAIVDSFAEGIDKRSAYAQSAMSRMAGQVRGQLGGGNFTATVQPKLAGSMGLAEIGGGKTIVFNEGAVQIHNPSAEPASTSMNNTMTKIGRFGLFGG
jgi:hypothetical protein